MGKRKKLLLVIASLIIVTGLLVGSYLMIFKSKPNSKTPVVKVQSQQELAASKAKITGFNDVIGAYNAKDYQKTITLAKAFGNDAKNQNTEKLNTYNLCILAAKELKQDQAKTDCYESAKQVANSLTYAQDKTLWLGALDDTYNGTQLHKGTDDGLPS